MAVSFYTTTTVNGTDQTVSLYAAAGSNLLAYNFTLNYDATVASFNNTTYYPANWVPPQNSIDSVTNGTGGVGDYESPTVKKGVTTDYPIGTTKDDLVVTLDFQLNTADVPTTGTILITSYQNTSVTVNNATLPTLTFACFAGGTMIASENGPVTVENLRAGDMIMTISGISRPIRWMGHRRVNGDDATQRPIHIRAHGFGPNLPARSLYVSPEHALFVDGVLVPAMNLVNGHSITQDAMGEITYFHVLLDRHDVILAEGLPAETLLLNDNADEFDNAATADDLPLFMEPFAPRVTQGERLGAILNRLRVTA